MSYAKMCSRWSKSTGAASILAVHFRIPPEGQCRNTLLELNARASHLLDHVDDRQHVVGDALGRVDVQLDLLPRSYGLHSQEIRHNRDARLVRDGLADENYAVLAQVANHVHLLQVTANQTTSPSAPSVTRDTKGDFDPRSPPKCS